MPTAAELPADPHDNELRETAGFDEAFTGKLACTPGAHNAANACDDNANSTPHTKPSTPSSSRARPTHKHSPKHNPLTMTT